MRTTFRTYSDRDFVAHITVLDCNALWPLGGWTDSHIPRTERPVRFMVVRAHPVFRAFSDAFRGNLPLTRIA